jgi:mannan endo-1,4-beta-mannosidase
MRQDAAEQATLMTTESSSQIYWGATIKGKTLDAAFSDPPWDMRGWDVFEEHAGKKISLLNIGNVWWNCEGTCRYKTFNYQKAQFDAIRNRGAIPFFTWQSQAKGDPNQPDSNFQLADIYRGNHDAFIRQWADEAALWGYPFFMRLDWEMNGSWYMWSEKQNGNQPGDYIKMWKHVWNVVNCVDDGVFHPLSSCVPATNVTWVWNINLDFPGSQPLEELYPGDTYVDWVGIDGYNFGTDPAKPDIWRTFTEAFKPTYDHVTALAPTKPIIVPETASTEYGGSKAQWITDALMREISATFPRIKGIMWFNWAFAESKGIVHYEIESSATAQQAFKDGIASSYFAAGDTIRFGNLPKLTKVKPLTVSSSLPTVSVTPSFTITPTKIPPNTPIPTQVFPTMTPVPISDSTSPTVSILNPKSGSIIARNNTVTLSATATDNIKVAKVTIIVDGKGGDFSCTDTTYPYTCSWSVSGKPDADYIITATATDASGNSASSRVAVISSK